MTEAQKVIKEYQEKSPDLAPTTLAKKIYRDFPNVFRSVEQIRSIIRGRTTGAVISFHESGKKPIPEFGNKAAIVKPISGKELRNMYNIKAIVMRALESLPYTEEGVFWRDADFIRKFELHGRPGYRSILESEETKPYRGKAQGQTIWGHPKSIQQMKNEGTLL
jgi:hypothetical protein